MNILILLKTTLTAMFPLFSISIVGASLTFMKTLDSRTNSSLSISGVNFFTPILNLAYISSSLDLSEFSLIWPVLISPLLFNLIFIPMGYLITNLSKIPKTMKNTLTIFLAAPNYTLVFTLTQGICSSYGPLSNNPYCPNAFSYIAIYGLSQSLIVWTIGYSLVEMDKTSSKVFGIDEGLNQQVTNRSSLWRNTLNTLKMPNPISCLFSIILALIPGFKEFFFYPGGTFLALGSALKNIGLIGIIWGQVLMGSNIFMMIGKKSRLKNKQIFFITCSKVLVFPAVTLGISFILWKAGVFGDDRVQAYVLFMCTTCPTSIVVVLFAVVLKINVDEISQCIFSVYLASIFTLVMWTFLFLLIII